MDTSRNSISMARELPINAIPTNIFYFQKLCYAARTVPQITLGIIHTHATKQCLDFFRFDEFSNRPFSSNSRHLINTANRRLPNQIICEASDELPVYLDEIH